jgi:NAD(P)H dehydrogenase (quinone)
MARALQRRSFRAGRERAVNISVIFYSMTGNTAALARAVADGAERAGADVRLRQVSELLPADVIPRNPKIREAKEKLADISLATNDDLIWADGVAFGSPTRYGNMSAQLKNFIDQTGSLWLSGRLVGKVAGVFCSTSTMHGGQETTLVSMMIPLFHLGFIVHGLPYAEAEQMSMADIHGGSPYGASSVSGSEGGRSPTEIDLTLARALGRRIAIAAGKLRGG